MFDLIALAFDADITRPVAFMLNREDGMGISDTFPLRPGLAQTHHRLSHASDKQAPARWVDRSSAGRERRVNTPRRTFLAARGLRAVIESELDHLNFQCREPGNEAQEIRELIIDGQVPKGVL